MPQLPDTHYSDIWLRGIKDSQDGDWVGKLVVSLSVWKKVTSQSKTIQHGVVDYFSAHNHVVTAFFVGLFESSFWKGYL